MLKHCLPPEVDARTQVLILGSLPGEASLAAAQYYAHPQNQFWRLLGALLDTDLHGRAYADRLACLRQHGIGVWDVVGQARRVGSLDTALRDVAFNDLNRLIADLPALKVVAFNGKTAVRARRRMAWDNAVLELPSSSPAFTLGFDAKLAAWQALLPFLG